MEKQSVKTKAVLMLLAGSIILASCSSTTMIQSIPSGAKIHVDGEPVGVTPYPHTDTKITGSATTVKLEKEGYLPLYSTFYRNEQPDIGAIIGGVFVWVPFLWVMRYNPVRTYELIPGSFNEVPGKTIQPGNQGISKPKEERLRDLKKLVDEKIITQEEFNTEKKKILDEK